MPIQSEMVVGVAKEAVYGTFVPPTKFVPCVPKINTNLKVQRPEQSRGTRAQVADVTTGYETEVTLTGELIPVVWSQLCALAMGNGSDSYSSSGGAAHHVLTPQPQCPSVSIEVDTDIIPGEQVLARRLVGGIVDRFQIKAAAQQFIQCEVQIIAQKETTPATPGAPSNVNPAYSTIQPMDFSLAAVEYKGVANAELKDTTIALLNKTVRVYSSNGLLTAARLVPTRREVTLTTNWDFLNTTIYTDWVESPKAKLTSGIVISFVTLTNIPSTAVPYKVQFTLPGLRPMGVWDNPAASDVLEQTLAYSATLSGPGEISSEWTNEEAGALA